MRGEMEAFERRFAGAGMGPIAWERFVRMYEVYRRGGEASVDWARLTPPKASDLCRLEHLERDGCARDGASRMGRLAWIVLNGGLGTSMRMDRPKSLLVVKDGLDFLSLITRHALSLRRLPDVRLPLVFMNSFATRAETLNALAAHPIAVPGDDGAPLPVEFEQHRFPRIRVDDGAPYGQAEDPSAWAPPGHGDLYASLASSGVLDALLASGFRWAFVSNADNLGASPDPAILGYLALSGLEILAEVTPRTQADLKGGAVTRLGERLHLLELAQVPPERLDEFQDTSRFAYFNTNSLWIDLAALAQRMRADGVPLPVIVNRKNLDGTPVVQLESAMGAALGVFEKSGLVVVPRSRFAPVKTMDDLLVRRSDVYRLGSLAPLELSERRDPLWGPPLVRLDPAFFGSPQDFDLRIPHPPSLVDARSLTVEGDVRFGRGVTVRGNAVLRQSGSGPLQVSDGAVVGEAA